MHPSEFVHLIASFGATCCVAPFVVNVQKPQVFFEKLSILTIGASIFQWKGYQPRIQLKFNIYAAVFNAWSTPGTTV
jgi:hypothetical protein